jgi:hypothetical protein
MFDQAMARRLSGCDELLLICGRYEGVDERVAEHLADEELSIGSYVLSGGELAAAVVVDAVARLLPGVVGNSDSTVWESFSPEREGGLDCPQYTRPAEFRGIDSIDGAGRLAGCELRIPKSRRAPLPEGEFYYSDLLGCEVIERATGESLGCVSDWHEYGGPGLLQVGELLIPFAKSIFLEIDLASRRIYVNLPEGLKDLAK